MLKFKEEGVMVMQKLAATTAIFLFCSTNITYGQNLIRQSFKVSPVGKMVAYLQQEKVDEGRYLPWTLIINKREFLPDVPGELGDHRNMLGIHDFAWSPDGLTIMFVLTPTTCRGEGSGSDTIGIIDAETLQYQWIDGKFLTGLTFDSPTAEYGRLHNFQLRWLNDNTIKFYSPAIRKSWQQPVIKKAGWKQMNVGVIRKHWVTNKARLPQAKTIFEKWLQAIIKNNRPEADSLLDDNYRQQGYPSFLFDNESNGRIIDRDLRHYQWKQQVEIFSDPLGKKSTITASLKIKLPDNFCISCNIRLSDFAIEQISAEYEWPNKEI